MTRFRVRKGIYIFWGFHSTALHARFFYSYRFK